MSVFGFERPSPERPKLSSLQAVMDAFPDVVLVIDSKEQLIQRSGGERSFPSERLLFRQEEGAHAQEPDC